VPSGACSRGSRAAINEARGKSRILAAGRSGDEARASSPHVQLVMKSQKLFRKLHYWAAAIAGLPIVIIIGAGILLQLKKQLQWVQPTEIRGSRGDPRVSFDQLLALARSVPEAGVQTWDDIPRVEGRPQKGLIKLISANNHEIQVDLVGGTILHSAHRRSDIIESIHDGSFFHAGAKLWLFLPAGIILFGMWCTGVYLFVIPLLSRRRKRARLAGLPGTPGPG
jgi:uncharacterized iron-regulated membrane protein